jgi:hypothetical protein
MSDDGPCARGVEVLLLGVRRTLDAEQRRRLACHLAGPLDWPFLFSEATRHGVGALLYDTLKRESLLDATPPEAAAGLSGLVTENVAVSLRLTGELRRIVQAFTQSWIAAIPFKGPALAISAYGGISLRSYCDLDLLVKPDDMAGARRILHELGYADDAVLNPRQEREYRRTECALQLQNARRGHVVELHWRLTERHASITLPIDEFWRRAVPLVIAGMTVPTFCPEDLLLYLCVHGAKHRWERLEWICSVAGVATRNSGLDWEAIVRAAEEYRVSRILRLGVLLAHSVAGGPMPPLIARGVERDAHVRGLAAAVESDLFAPRMGPHYRQRAAHYRFLLSTRERWLDRVRILWFSAMKPPHPHAPEWADVPPGLAFLQLLLRPLRLAGRYGRTVWQPGGGAANGAAAAPTDSRQA